MATDDGGPAFPRAGFYGEGSDRHDNTPEVGMSLRDWLAGMAMQGLLASDGGAQTSPKVYARDAYEYADAMIAARKESP